MDVNLAMPGSGKTPLHLLLACRGKTPETPGLAWWDTLRVLRHLGADVFARDADGACGVCALISAGRDGLLPAVFSEEGGGFDRADLARHVRVRLFL
jgi:hypothetical protein